MLTGWVRFQVHRADLWASPVCHAGDPRNLPTPSFFLSPRPLGVGRPRWLSGSLTLLAVINEAFRERGQLSISLGPTKTWVTLPWHGTFPPVGPVSSTLKCGTEVPPAPHPRSWVGAGRGRQPPALPRVELHSRGNWARRRDLPKPPVSRRRWARLAGTRREAELTPKRGGGNWCASKLRTNCERRCQPRAQVLRAGSGSGSRPHPFLLPLLRPLDSTWLRPQAPGKGSRALLPPGSIPVHRRPSSAPSPVSKLPHPFLPTPSFRSRFPLHLYFLKCTAMLILF